MDRDTTEYVCGIHSDEYLPNQLIHEKDTGEYLCEYDKGCKLPAYYKISHEYDDYNKRLFEVGILKSMPNRFCPTCGTKHTDKISITKSSCKKCGIAFVISDNKRRKQCHYKKEEHD